MNTTDAIPSATPIPLSILLLRRLQPLMEALLRSPLHRLLSRDLLVLGYTGRRSGRRLRLPLSYVERDGALVLCTRPGASQWWRNLKGGAEVEVLLRGRRVRAAARILDPASKEAADGLRVFVARNPRTGKMLYHVEPTPRGPSEADLEREAPQSVVVELRLL